MVALDNHSHAAFHTAPRIRLGLPGLVALGALILVLGAIAARGFSDNGFRLGSQMAWRFTGVVLFFTLIGGPLARMTAYRRPATDAARICRQLDWSFCASYAVYLVSVLLPNMMGREGLSLGTSLFLAVGSMVTVAMALAADPARLQGLGDKARRAIAGLAAIYFWMCYSLMALAHLSGPHRPDGFYGFSLMLMIAALLMRFGERLAEHWSWGTQPRQPA
jgi:hypothetical protein